MPHIVDDTQMPVQERLRHTLGARAPQRLPCDVRAAVAVLFDRTSEPSLLFIRRAEHPADPWSGHVAFPGGKHDEGDRDLRATAQRETREEIGLDLANADYLGQLDDLHTNISAFVVSGFAYAVPTPPTLHLSEEVEDCFWVPLSHLTQPERPTHLTFDGREFPALSLGPHRPLLWGITYRFVEQVLGRLGRQQD